MAAMPSMHSPFLSRPAHDLHWAFRRLLAHEAGQTGSVEGGQAIEADAVGLLRIQGEEDFADE
jgi:hypothetical protein